MPKAPTHYRRCCITWFVPELGPRPSYYKATVEALPHIRHAVWQVERAPTTGRLHLQMYAEFRSPVRPHAIQRHFPGAHVEESKGSYEQNKAYCTKEETRVEGPFRLGSH